MNRPRTSRIGNSWNFSKQCLVFLRQNLDLLTYVVLSFISAIVFIVVFAFTGLPFINGQSYTNHQLWTMIPIWVVSAFIFYSIIIFFNSAMIACINKRMQGEKASLGAGFALAMQRLPKILGWSLISAFIGTIFNVLENSHSLIEKIIAFILSVSWGLVSFFVLPIIINENIGPIDAIKRSAKMFGRGWRKIVKVNLIIGLIILATIFAVIGLISLVGSISPVLLWPVLAILILMIPASLALSTVLTATAQTALYLHFHKQFTPNGFSADLLDAAVRKRNLSRGK